MAESAINEKTVEIVQEKKMYAIRNVIFIMVSDMIHGEKSIVLDPKARKGRPNTKHH